MPSKSQIVYIIIIISHTLTSNMKKKLVAFRFHIVRLLTKGAVTMKCDTMSDIHIMYRATTIHCTLHIAHKYNVTYTQHISTGPQTHTQLKYIIIKMKWEMV